MLSHRTLFFSTVICFNLLFVGCKWSLAGGNGGGYGGILLYFYEGDKAPNIDGDRYFLEYQEGETCSTPTTSLASVNGYVGSYLIQNPAHQVTTFADSLCSTPTAISSDDILKLSYVPNILIFQDQIFLGYDSLPTSPTEVEPLSLFCHNAKMNSAGDVGYSTEIYFAREANVAKVVLRKGQIQNGQAESYFSLPFIVQIARSSDSMQFRNSDFALSFDNPSTNPISAHLTMLVNGDRVQMNLDCWD